MVFGVSLALVRDHRFICGGRIGRAGASVFCAKESETACTTQTHKSKKIFFATDEALRKEMGPTLYFIQSRSSKTLVMESSLPVGDLDQEEVSSLLGQSFSSLDEWKEEVETRTTALLYKVSVDNVRTARKKARESSADVVDGLVSSVGEAIGDLRKSFSEAKPEESRASPDSYEVIEGKQLFKSEEDGSSNKMEDEIIRLTEITAEKTTHELVASVRSELWAFIGDKGSIVAELGGSLVNGIKTMNESVAKLARRLGNIENLADDTFVSQLVRKVFLHKIFVSYMKGTKEFLENLELRVVGLEKEKSKTKASVDDSLINDFTPKFGQMAMGRRHDDKEDGEAGNHLRQMVKDLEKRVDQLSEHTAEDQKAVGDMSVSFNDRTFHSAADVYNEFRNPASGDMPFAPDVIYDSLTVFDYLLGEMWGYGSDRHIPLSKAQTLPMSIMSINHVQAACKTGLPEFFDSSTGSNRKLYVEGSVGSKKAVFNHIESYQLWGPVGHHPTSIRARATKHLQRLRREATSRINELKSPELVLFLLAMLDQSIIFVEEVFRFLTEEHETIRGYFPDPKGCWNFVCYAVEHAFVSEFQVARSVITTPDITDVSGTTVKVMWTALRTLSVQDTFIKVGFENHPSLSSAYSRFMLTNMPNEEVSNLTKQVSELQSTVKALQDSLKKTSRITDQNTSSLANLNGKSKKKKISQEGGDE